MPIVVKDILKSGVYPPVMFLFGEEDFSVYESASALYAKASADDLSGMNSDILDGDGMSLDAILMMARSFPMMGDRRVIWIRRFEKVTGGKDRKGNDLMAQYLADPTPTSVLIFTGSYSALDGLTSQIQKAESTANRKMASQKAPLGALLASGNWVEYPRMKEAGLRTWLQHRAKSLGIILEDEAASFIVARTGTSVREVSLELDKVLTFIGEATTVSADDVTRVVGANKSVTVFELQKAIGRADIGAAYTIVSKMLATERQEMLIIAMLARYFTSLFKLIDIQGSNDRALIARACGIAPYAIPEYLDSLRVLGPARVERGLIELMECDAQIKSSSTDAMVVLQTAISRILDPR